MKAVWSWLLELCDLPNVPTVEEGAAALTGGGLEVEGITDLGRGFSGVVVAEVVGKRPHPQSDKLTLVDVITARGGSATQVVCGAPNVPEPGRKVLWAPPGATLPGGMTLAVKAVKGVESPGMLCSETELEIGDDDSGIIVLDEGDGVALGAPAQQALGVDDWMIEVNAPANRGDCLGHLGLARELCALLGGRLVPPAPEPDLDALAAELDTAALAAVTIADPDGCPRYLARVIDGLTVRPSPRRFAQRLRAVGVRPISNLVDVTNYVLFEIGQPLHAFDWHHVRGARIEVRRARAGETMTTLDGQARALVPDDLLICDGEGPVALAGVMGGAESEVSASTTRVLLESASFQPRSIRRTARRFALPSEASQRFERGVDPELAPLAAARASVLLARLGGGRIARGAVDVYPAPAVRPRVPLRLSRTRALIGADLSAEQCEAALGRLGCDVERSGDGTWTVTPPSARADLTREVDLIEDVLRVHGYTNVPATVPALRAGPSPLVDDVADRARRALAGAGLAEAITYGFQSRERVAALRLPASDRRAHPVAVRNPMSAEQAVMRTSLLPNLVGAVARNASFGISDATLFEVGAVFLRKEGQPLEGEPTQLLDEPLHAAAVLTGARPAWLGPAQAWDFFDAKGVLEHLVRSLGGGELRYVAASDIPYLHPGVAARIFTGDGTLVGEIGEVHPATREALGVEAPVFAFQIMLEALPPALPRQMRPVPRFPASSRDVSLLLDAPIPAARVRDVIVGAGQALVEAVRLAEEYRDAAKLGAAKKSMLWSITYRAPDRTLTDAEVDAAHEAIVARLIAETPAERR